MCMKAFRLFLVITALTGWGCASSDTKSPEVAGAIRQSLSSAGLRDVSVSQDREKGVVRLGGHVSAEGQRQQAGSIANSLAAGQVVANEIEVVAPGVESASKQINSDVDDGIEKNLHAALISSSLDKEVKYSVKNGVITLTGTVNSEATRTQAAQVAASIPYQRQVVNELQIRDRKASTN